MKVRAKVEGVTETSVTLNIVEDEARPNTKASGQITIGGQDAASIRGFIAGGYVQVNVVPLDDATGEKIKRDDARRRAEVTGLQEDVQEKLAQDSSKIDVAAARESKRKSLDPLEEERVRSGRPLNDSELKAREEQRAQNQTRREGQAVQGGRTTSMHEQPVTGRPGTDTAAIRPTSETPAAVAEKKAAEAKRDERR